MAIWEPSKLRPRHYEIIRQAFFGKTHKEIAGEMGLHEVTVATVLRSPLAQAEMAGMVAAAKQLVVDAPLRAKVQETLENAAEEAIELRRSVMNCEAAPLTLRTNIARHFMDRVIFDTDDDGKAGSYREILRKLDEVQRQLGSDTILVNPAPAEAPSPAPADPVVTRELEALDSGNGNGSH